MKIRQNAQFSLYTASTKIAGTWRDLNFQPILKIFVFFIHLGQELKVLKCVLRSDNFDQILGTLIYINAI